MRAWRREITLVVDDGPSPATALLLDTLERARHRAVLFVLGCNVVDNQAILVDAVRRGFALGNHSYMHLRFSTLDRDAAREEIERTEVLIDDVYRSAGLKRPARWFRFPYLDQGGTRAAVFQQLLAELGFRARPKSFWTGTSAPRSIDWQTTVTTGDWELPPDGLFDARLGRARSGDVVDFHDKAETVPRYVERLCAGLERAGLRAVVPG